MPIEVMKDGSTVVTGESIAFFRLASLKSALGLELKGLRLSRGRSAYAIAKKELGLRGNKQKVYDILCKIVENESAKQTRVYEEPNNEG